jgi:hypothetical protein
VTSDAGKAGRSSRPAILQESGNRKVIFCNDENSFTVWMAPPGPAPRVLNQIMKKFVLLVLASTAGLLLPGRSDAQPVFSNVPGINVPPNFTNRVNRYLTNELPGATNVPPYFTNRNGPLFTNPLAGQFTNASNRFLTNGQAGITNLRRNTNTVSDLLPNPGLPFTNGSNRLVTNAATGLTNVRRGFTNINGQVFTNPRARFTNQGRPAQIPPNQVPPNRLPGQLPPGQVPPNQFPPNQVPPNQVPPDQVPPDQVPPNVVPNEIPPGPFQPGNTVPPKRTLPNAPVRPAIR